MREIRWYKGEYKVEIVKHGSRKSLVHPVEDLPFHNKAYDFLKKTEVPNSLLWKKRKPLIFTHPFNIPKNMVPKRSIP